MRTANHANHANSPKAIRPFASFLSVAVASRASGRAFVTRTPAPFTHDPDGNLTQDGRWDYTWDAENRVVKMESRSGAPTGSKRRLEFAYDGKARRIWKKVTNLDTSTVLSEEKYVYDGWNLIAILDHQSSILHSFTWGLDLSGTLQGAGGVGGLLSVSNVSSGLHFCGYDGNGNVAVLAKGTDGSVTANYEYGPFGETLRVTGTMAKANPFRFSTKFQDDESDFLYYGYRSYNPSTGRWLNRDPIDTDGGLNIYAFVGNNPMKYIDPDGRAPKNVQCGGVCGSVIDDWIGDEIKAQKAGWDRWKKDNGSKASIDDYIKWANGNQRYKDAKFFVFNSGTSCGKKDKDAEVGCGISVTLCGKCVRSAILGNIMYGLVGNYAGFTDQQLKEAGDWKRSVGMDVDKYDEEAYKLGEDVNGAADFCSKFNELLKKTPSAIYEGRKDGGYNDLSTCRPCTEKTRAKNHGGNEKPRLTP